MREPVVVASIVLTLIAGGAGRVGARPPQEKPSPLLGMWGGDRIRIDGAATGARLQVDCLRASTDDAVQLDAAGSFNFMVTFVPIRGAALDGLEDRAPSRVTGHVDKDVLTITIAPEDTEPAGTFTLERSRKARLPNCRFRG